MSTLLSALAPAPREHGREYGLSVELYVSAAYYGGMAVALALVGAEDSAAWAARCAGHDARLWVADREEREA